MELVSIINEEQYDNVRRVIIESNHTELEDIYWTSGVDLGNENNFFWTSNGDFFDFEPWHHNQPDNANNDEHCIELRNWNNVYKLNDNNCNARIYFICSRIEDKEYGPCSPSAASLTSVASKTNCVCN